MKKNTNTAEYASRVKRGYLKKHKKQPTNNQLDKLTKKQIKQYYKAGSPKHTKLIYKVIIFTGIGIALFIGIATAVLASKYYSILRYQQLAQEIDRKAEAKSSDIVFKECYSKYKYVYYPGPNPKEYYESISKGYTACSAENKSTTSSVTPVQTEGGGSNQPGTTTNPGSNPGATPLNYTDASCVERVIPRTTIYEYISVQPQSYTRIDEGHDGIEETCTYKSGQVYTWTKRTPYPTTIYQGTQVTQQPPPNSGPTLEQARQLCSQYGDSSAFYQCLRGYGY